MTTRRGNFGLSSSEERTVARVLPVVISRLAVEVADKLADDTTATTPTAREMTSVYDDLALSHRIGDQKGCIEALTRARRLNRTAIFPKPTKAAVDRALYHIKNGRSLTGRRSALGGVA